MARFLLLFTFFLFYSSACFAVNIGPFSAGEPGDTVTMRAIIENTPNVDEVNEAHQKFLSLSVDEVRSILSHYPVAYEDKLLFSVINYFLLDSIEGTSISGSPLLLSTSNYENTLIGAYVRGYLSVKELIGDLSFSTIQEVIVKALSFEKENYVEIGNGTHEYFINGGWSLKKFPIDGTFDEKLEWAIDVNWLEWNPMTVHKSKEEKQFYYAAATAVLTKNHYEMSQTLKLSREVFVTSQNEQRVFSYLDSNLENPQGNPLIVFLHGSFGNFVPEQEKSYVDIAKAFAAKGYSVALPVGSPQTRSDYKNTGMGMLNWDPIGADKKGANSVFIIDLIKHLNKAKNLNPGKVFLVGHSQGGFAASNLIAHFPEEFKGAALIGAGGGTYHRLLNSKLRKTPVMLLTGTIDPHLNITKSYYNFLLSIGYDKNNLQLVTPKDRNHLVTPQADADIINKFFKTLL